MPLTNRNVIKSSTQNMSTVYLLWYFLYHDLLSLINDDSRTDQLLSFSKISVLISYCNSYPLTNYFYRQCLIFLAIAKHMISFRYVCVKVWFISLWKIFVLYCIICKNTEWPFQCRNITAVPILAWTLTPHKTYIISINLY